ncbi:MAG: hypothetical protein J5802_10805 [Butyrivibrio sp.]|nr:hypothetical protein [Butyrivibrio sp.]
MGLFDFFKKKEIISFAEIDSVSKAKKEVRNGNLEKMFIMSPMFGGATDESNILYVPVGVNKIKESYDNMLADLVEQGKAVSFDCTPEYRGDSVVPCKITLTAGGDGEDTFNQTINVW